jgi:hypothetical protein
VADDTALFDGALSAGDALKDGKSSPRILVGLDVHEIGRRPPVLGDEHWVTLALKLGDDLGRPALEGGDKFGSHEVILK